MTYVTLAGVLSMTMFVRLHGRRVVGLQSSGLIVELVKRAAPRATVTNPKMAAAS
jgi:hypothetical protein